jgi:DNA processing protein
MVAHDQALELNQHELYGWLKLLFACKLNIRLFAQILSQVTSINEVFTLSAADLIQMGCSETLLPALFSTNCPMADAAMQWQNGLDRSILTWGSKDYPSLLSEIPYSPPILFVHGDRYLLSALQCAIIGSRKATPKGLWLARRFATELAANSFVVTSGLAYGIDHAAHLGVLDAQGKTIAVLGTGVDNIYPVAHIDLAKHIVAQGGALVSEFPLGTPPKAENFPRRNRILSGLCHGVLVVEAAKRSGSLITARYALEQGREVFALPGSIDSLSHHGCHKLIQQGAKLVENIHDILEEFEHILPKLPKIPKPSVMGNPHSLAADRAQELANRYQKLLAFLVSDTATTDQLAMYCRLPVQEVAQMLAELELQGVVCQTPFGYQKI